MASRSLGTLTIDLIAKIGGFTQGMTEAERVTDKKSREIQKKMEARAKEIDDAWSKMSLALAVGVTGLGAMVSKVVSDAGEISNLASIANATTTEFQRMAAGASMVGIQQDKLGDQLKDFTEKVGEFQANGGGGMKDFFEQIAPKVGVTADAFRGLSGPQALQLYYNSLEKAGLSQQQMSFYLESMASDTTALIPLLADGGKLMGELGDAAEATGAVMDDKTIRAAQELQIATEVLQGQTRGLANEMVGSMLPTLVDLAGGLADTSLESGIASEAGETFAGALKTVVATAVGAYASVVLLGKGLGGLGAVIAADWKDKGNVASIVMQDLEEQAARYGGVIDKVWSAGTDASGTDWGARIKEMADARAKALAALRGAPGAKITPAEKKTGKSPAEKDQEAAERFLQSLRDQAFKVQERTAWEQLHYDIQTKGLKLSDQQLAQAQGLATAADMLKEAERQRAAEIDQQNTLYQLQERLMGAQQRNQLEMLTYGMGDQAAQDMRARIALQQQQQAELRQMQHEHGQELRAAETEDQRSRLQAMFQERYRLTEEAMQQELQLFDQAGQQKRQKELDWVSGARASLATYQENARNAYDASRRAADAAFGGMEDALVNFAMTGKASFSGLARSIIADLIRIQIRAQLAGVFGRIFGAPQLASSGVTAGGVDAMNGYSGGGYTGPGGKYQPAGIVHKGEGVLSQDDIAALGGPRGFEAFRASLHRSYAGGGVVGAAATVAAPTGGAGLEVHVHNHAGAQIEQRQRTGPDGKAILDIFISEAAAQVAGDYGPMGQAMRQRSRMGGA